MEINWTNEFHGESFLKRNINCLIQFAPSKYSSFETSFSQNILFNFKFSSFRCEFTLVGFKHFFYGFHSFHFY